MKLLKHAIGKAARVVRTTGFPERAKIIAGDRDLALLKQHPDYGAAKRGNIEAATRLVLDLVDQRNMDAACAEFGNPADLIFLPVVAQELAGRNAIPNALAALYAHCTGGELSSEVVQITKSYHTGADAMERLIARAEFDGHVEAGRRYVLVDDVSTMGGTLADLASFIQEKGGIVAGAVLMTNASRTGSICPSRKITDQLGERHGKEIERLFGVATHALTRDEAQYLIGFRTTDELRNRAASAVAKRASRISSKVFPRPQNAVGLLFTSSPCRSFGDEAPAGLPSAPAPTPSFK